MGRFQMAMAERNRVIMESNARATERDMRRAETAVGETAFAGATAGMQQDYSARAQIGEAAARAGTSGLRGIREPSVLRRLAAMDRENLVRSGLADVIDARSRVSTLEGEAAGQRMAAVGMHDEGQLAQAQARAAADRARWNIAGGVATTLIGAASNPMVDNWMKRRQPRQMQRGTPGIGVW